MAAWVPRCLVALSVAAAYAASAGHSSAQDCTDPCSDNNVCTVNDHCSNGHCRGATLPNGTACDDGDPRTSNDACHAGICEGVPADGGEAGAPDTDAQVDADAQGQAEARSEAGDSGGCSAAGGRGANSWWLGLAGLAALAERARSRAPRQR